MFLVLSCLILVFLPGGVAAGQKGKQGRPPQQPPQSQAVAMTPGFAVKPGDVTIPDGVPVGQYRRIIRPFQNWTQICDENLKAKKRVCNISQTVVHETGITVLSWSLAATETGQPFMIVRVPSMVGQGKDIQLDFRDKTAPIKIQTTGCDRNICLSYLPVGPRMRVYIAKGNMPEISYDVPDRQGQSSRISFLAPLQGLSQALAAI
ncbi:hypothetical protein AVM02_06835 [Brucella anthropi]